MKNYKGSCHCGVVTFEARTELNKVISCNCSICRKKGALHLRVPSDQFQLLSGKEDLNLYQFNTKTAFHYFCKHCGIHPFSHPRIDPEAISINVKCVDHVDLEEEFEIINFDGKNWEAAAGTVKN